MDEGTFHFTCTPRPERKGVPTRGNSTHKGLVIGNLGGFLPAGEDVCLGGRPEGEAEAAEEGVADR